MNRLRHIHLPESAPHQPPISFARAIDKFYSQLFQEGRPGLLGGKDVENKLACPPPAVLSFTPDPVYVKRNAEKNYKDRQSSSKPLRLTWPRLPGSLPPLSNIGGESPAFKKKMALVPGFRFQRDPFDHTYHPQVIQPSQKFMPRYLGPGRLVLWPIMDMNGLSTIGTKSDLVQEHSALLADVTMAMLKREFGLETFIDRGLSSLTVRSGAEIAAIWPRVLQGVSSCGVSINIAEPTSIEGAPGGESHHRLHDSSQVPPSRNFTTVAAELASADAELPQGRNQIVKLTSSRSPEASGTEGSQVFYTTTHDGTTSQAPLGMENYSIAVSWTYELASMLNIPIVDHKGTRSWDQRKLFRATNFDRLPVRPRIVTEHQAQYQKHHSTGPKSEFAKFWGGDVGINDRVPSWMLTQTRMMRDLSESTQGRKQDTRKSAAAAGPQAVDEAMVEWLKQGPCDLEMRIFGKNGVGRPPGLEGISKRQEHTGKGKIMPPPNNPDGRTSSIRPNKMPRESRKIQFF